MFLQFFQVLILHLGEDLVMPDGELMEFLLYVHQILTFIFFDIAKFLLPIFLFLEALCFELIL